MRILAIETTGPYCSVALLDEEDNITEILNEERLNHLKSLTPMIEELLNKSQLQLNDIDVIAVSQGPGSFTGIRIGISTARAISQITGIKLMAIPTLFAFGCGYCEGDKIVCPLFDARRNQVYAGAYRDYEEVVKAAPYELEDLLSRMESWDNILFIGDGVKPYRKEIEAWGVGKNIQIKEVYQEAGFVAELAKETLDEKLLLSYEKLKPDYMRLPEAERKLQKNQSTLNK